MYEHHIKEMATIVAKKLVEIEGWGDVGLWTETFQDALSKYWEDKIAEVWSVDDVVDMAVAIDLEINDEEAKKILHTILDKHDANVGISWDTIETHIGNYILKRNQK